MVNRLRVSGACIATVSSAERNTALTPVIGINFSNLA